MINTRNAGLLLGLGILGTLAIVPASAQVVISQVYGGGGNAGATITNDFVELFNNGATPFSLTGTSLQYASNTGNFNAKLDLTGTVQPGRFFLIKLAAGANPGTFNVTPDQDGSGAGALTLGAANGKVAFANTTTLLGTSVAANGASIIDYVGYGTATTFEGAGAAPAPSNTTSIVRLPGVLPNTFLDTNSNVANFAVQNPPILRNSTVPAPSSVAVMALGGLMPLIAIARRRRSVK